MFEILFTNQPALFIPVLSIAAAAVVFGIWIVSHYWNDVRRQEIDAALKQDMLNRGMSAADIERVLLASQTPRPPVVEQKADPISNNEYSLVEKMLDEGHSIDDVERIVRAFKQPDYARE